MLSTGQEQRPPDNRRGGNPALVPLLRLRAARVRHALAAVMRPEDAPLGHARGHDVDRLLILGSGPALGWGVTTHELALPGSLARSLTAITGCGSTVDLVAREDLRAGEAAAVVADRDLLRYGAIVLVLGSAEAASLTSPSRWTQDLAELVAELNRRAPGVPVVVTGVRPVRVPGSGRRLDRVEDGHAAALDAETEALCDAVPSATFVPTTGEAAHPTDPDEALASFSAWGSALADRVAPLLASAEDGGGDRRERRRDRRREDRDAAAEEARRQSVVDTFASAARTSEVDLDHILSLARRAFKTDAALVTVLDRDRQFHLAATGSGLAEVPWSASFSEFALLDSEATVVRDIALDERFGSSPLLSGQHSMRFYAGFPIEAPTGERIGALCVLDSHPRRRADDIDTDLLRELAIMVQREMWRFLPAAGE
ncbi:GAF domain-containing protein [Microbacteriaceae bacterium 4G12]